jgi:hypothetical protein
VVGDGVGRTLLISSGARVVGAGVGTSSCICFFHMPGTLGLSSPGSVVLAGVVGIGSSINVGTWVLHSLIWHPGGSGKSRFLLVDLGSGTCRGGVWISPLLTNSSNVPLVIVCLHSCRDLVRSAGLLCFPS